MGNNSSIAARAAELMGEAAARLVFKADDILYKTLGVASPARRAAWRRRARRLQQELDDQHDKRDRVNMFLGRDYNTKDALRIYYGGEDYDK